MADKWAFALKESFAKDFAGGSTTITDGKTLDFGARLKNSSDGVIVVTDPIEADALSAWTPSSRSRFRTSRSRSTSPRLRRLRRRSPNGPSRAKPSWPMVG